MQSEFDLHVATDNDGQAQQERNALRERYRARLAEKLKDPEFRKIEGFPIGTDEAILALSDPPYYTACPNPFLEEWLAENAKPYDAATDDYHREPFAADVSEGKNDPIYNAHSYHTKVPHKAIMRYILHYTEPGDVVYDGFCGTGMTGVAAQMCGDKAQIESLGYTVCADGTILDETGKSFSKFGARKAILNDLSPAATFIAYNYNTPVDAIAFEREAKRILKEVEDECGWMYSTLHGASPEETDRISEVVRQCKSLDELRALYEGLLSLHSPLRDPNSTLYIGRIHYTVWSDVFICSNCSGEIIFWDAAVDEKAGEVRDIFACPRCRAETTKRQCERATVTFHDAAMSQTVTQIKQVVVLVNYSIGKKRHTRLPNAHDIALVETLNRLPMPYWFPTDLYLNKGEKWGDTYRAGYCAGVTHTHHFFTSRNAAVLSIFSHYAKTCSMPIDFVMTGILNRSTKMNRIHLKKFFFGGGGWNAGYLKGTIYISSLPIETSIIEQFEDRTHDVSAAYRLIRSSLGQTIVSTSSASHNPLGDGIVDYIFTDPPFGDNLQYSELNFLWESWLRVLTNNIPEAVMSNSQKKRLVEYQSLITGSFAVNYRLLKPGRWMTVEFHNSSNSVWNAIQEGLERVGFVVADVRVLDKKQQGFNAIVAASAVKVTPQ